jgi:D-aminoacyl-tRNA deacylase
MRGLVQRVLQASVTVAGDPVDAEAPRQTVGAIGAGLCVLVGVTHDDTEATARKLADKIWGLRVIDDENGVMNRSVADTGGEVMIISQFTLYGDTSGGRRPSWINAARPEHAEPLVETVIDQLRASGATVATGRFRTEMEVSLVNDGPVTVLLEV